MLLAYKLQFQNCKIGLAILDMVHIFSILASEFLILLPRSLLKGPTGIRTQDLLFTRQAL